MNRSTGQPIHRRAGGFSLIELMIAGLLATLLLTGLVQVAAGARSSFALQEDVADLQERARFGLDRLRGALRQAAFAPEPWAGDPFDGEPAVTGTDGGAAGSDRLVLRSHSDRNCFGTRNPDRDPGGDPAFHLKEEVLERNGSDNLAWTCRYGPDDASLTTQVSRQGLMSGVESLQVLYAEDTDGDGRADRWVRAGFWDDVDAIVGLQVGLLLAGTSRDAGPRSESGAPVTVNVLDRVVTVPDDSRRRRVVTIAHALRGRPGGR